MNAEKTAVRVTRLRAWMINHLAPSTDEAPPMLTPEESRFLNTVMRMTWERHVLYPRRRLATIRRDQLRRWRLWGKP